MKDHSPTVAPILKGDKFNLDHCPENDLEQEQMKNIPHASIIGSLKYAQVCIQPDIAYVVGMLGRYKSNLGVDHQKATKKVMRSLQGTKDYMFMYKKTNDLEVIGYSNAVYVGYIDSWKSTSRYVFMLSGEAVSWRRAKQTLIATSIMEIEFISCFKATLHGVFLKIFIYGLRLIDSISPSLGLYCDN